MPIAQPWREEARVERASRLGLSEAGKFGLCVLDELQHLQAVILGPQVELTLWPKERNSR